MKHKEAEAHWYKAIEKCEQDESIADPYVRMVTALMVENQHLMNELYPEKTTDKSLEIVGKVVPNLLAHKIVSVQPKLAPNTNVYYPKYSFVDGSIQSTIEEESMISKTRKLRTYANPVDDVDLVAQQIVDEINNEILTDLRNNAGTITTVDVDCEWEGLHSKITQISHIIYRKTLRADRQYWIVISPDVRDRYSELWEALQHSIYQIHVVDNFVDNTILMGQKPNNFYDADYIYAPYIMLSRTPEIFSEDFMPRLGFLIRYGKKLTRGGAKAYARIMLPSLSESHAAKLKRNGNAINN